ncbi:CPBP family intramembrane glutamic endopeptidase [Burkholderia gladioli]|uniref:CPBP family intramembrane glutamic endopeptidase n=1 Tax=Burkholderia gladioli TaxID=28095 RepID=UPI00163E7AAF|nr:CPBP family intramembrane glutamic endopeptidase [Burkholderia gladioli]
MTTDRSRPPTFARFSRLWFGPAGLRTGWAALLYAAIVAVLMAGADWLARRLGLPFRLQGEVSAAHQVVFELAMCGAVLVATRVMSRIDRRAWLDFGLRAPRRLQHLLLGGACGLAAVSAIMALLVATGGATLAYSGMSLAAALEAGLTWAFAFALVAAAEELAFRGYLFFRLAQGIPPTAAAVLTSLAFGLAHMSNHGENMAGIVPVVIYGFVACLAIWRTGSLWWVFGVHATWDWSESFLFGAPNSGLVPSSSLLESHAIGPVWLSGGTVGPEGSVLVFPALGALAWVAWRALPATGDAARAASGTRPARGGAGRAG